MIAHDDNLDRVAGQPARIKDVPLAFVRSLRIPFPPREPGAPDPQQTVPVSDPRLLRVPTLKEVVDRYRNCLINVEIKDPDATDDVIALLAGKETTDRSAGVTPPFDLGTSVCFASFSDQVGQKVQRRSRRPATPTRPWPLPAPPCRARCPARCSFIPAPAQTTTCSRCPTG